MENTTQLPNAWVLSHRSTALVIVETMLFFINATAALFGNAMVCLAVYRNPRLRSTTNLYITALAVTDMLTALICQAFTTGVLITGRWIYGSVCVFFGFFGHYFIFCSVYTMTITAVNRYCRIVKPQLYKKIFIFKNSVAIIVSTWAFLAFVAGLPVIVGKASFRFLPYFAGCGWYFHTEAANIGFNVFQAVLCAGIPSVVIVFSYIKVSRTIRIHNANIQGTLQNGSTISVEEIKITKTLYALVVGFALCWIPSFSVVAFTQIILSYIPHGVAFVAAYLIGLSSAINPFIYGAMNRSFRKEFCKILSCGRWQPAVRPEARRREQPTLSIQG